MEPYIFRKNTTIGNLDAETDSFLTDCFYETEIYKTLINYDNDDNLDFTKRIIIGRTGSGKTALLKQIAIDRKITKHDVIEAENTVFEHIKNNIFISQLMEEDVDLRVFYKSLWLHVLLVKVINLLYPSNNFFDFLSNLTSVKKRYNLDLARQYVDTYQDNFFNENIVSEITDKMQNEISGGFSSGGAKLSGKFSGETSEKIQRETASYVSRELLRKQKELIKLIKDESSSEKQVRIIISIDDLDKSWLSSSKIRYDFINALLEAFKELLDIKSVKILISIRTDIIMGIYNNSLRQEEKDQSLILPITWNKVEIRKILDNRINFLIKHQYRGTQNVTFKDVFNFNVIDENADDFILNRTMLRPRDAINFVNLCLSEGDGSIELNEDLVIEAEEKFYYSRKLALEKEWVSIYSQIHCYLDSISFISKQTFKISDISKDQILNYILENSEDNIKDDYHDKVALIFEELVKVWFVIGVIGIKKTKTLTMYSSFEKPYLDITDFKKEFEIHPLFYR
ncbi:DNA repair protein [Photobacterium carnosum]|uniref:KAP family NTPase n=1 Tax=Photobacterium carnosum TaxID=2023717 RepID=UPI001E39172B|nr:KAP family NTPase [Photobacterium carnosum]MCD9521695.1 DNA repair protein [Photobacterium carnosum]